MNKENLIEKGFMPKKVYDYDIWEDGFEYSVVKKNKIKTTVKDFHGKILCIYHSILEN